MALAIGNAYRAIASCQLPNEQGKEEEMNQKITFKYFYGNEADQYSFYRIPKILFTDDYFKCLSSDAKILYGLMLDRMSLSIKNQWFDEQNRAYIYFSVEDIMEMLNCGRNKAIKSLQELDDETGIGLIEKRRQGFGKANIIYVKSFMIREAAEEIPVTEAEKFTKQTTEEKVENTEVYKTNFKKSQKQTSRSPENKLQEVYISNSNYNNINNNNQSDNKSNHILSADKGYDNDESEIIQGYMDLIRENIDYDSLIAVYPFERNVIDGIYDLIVETVLCKNDKVLIASNWYPAELVKSKFLKLTYTHVEYVLECMRKTTTKIVNIKKYLLAALFNAPTTIDSYYKAEVNHDMPQFAG